MLDASPPEDGYIDYLIKGSLRHAAEFNLHAMAENVFGYEPFWDQYVMAGIRERESAGYPEERLQDLIRRRATRLSDITRLDGSVAAWRHARTQANQMNATGRRIVSHHTQNYS